MMVEKIIELLKFISKTFITSAKLGTYRSYVIFLAVLTPNALQFTSHNCQNINRGENLKVIM